MKKGIYLLTLLVVMFGYGFGSQPTLAESSVVDIYSNSDAQLYTIDVETGEQKTIGQFGDVQVADIAFIGDTLYGVTFNDLVTIDLDTGELSPIGSTGFATVNSLAAYDGDLYAATFTGQIMKLDPATGAATDVVFFENGLVASGDIAFDNAGNLYATVKVDGASNDWLAKVDPLTGSATLLGDMGYVDIYALTFSKGVMYAGDGYGIMYTVDLDSGAATQIFGQFGSFWGMASPQAELTAVTLQNQTTSASSPTLALGVVLVSLLIGSAVLIRFSAREN